MFNRDEIIAIDRIIEALRECHFSLIQGGEAMAMGIYANRLLKLKDKIAKAIADDEEKPKGNETLSGGKITPIEPPKEAEKKEDKETKSKEKDKGKK